MWLRSKTLIYIIIFIALAGLVGCIKESKLVAPNETYKEVINDEDILIMQGFLALDAQNLEKAKEIFTQAYKQFPNPSYLKEILGILIAQGFIDEAKKEAYSFLQKYNDEEVRSALVGILVSTKDSDAALKEAKILVKNNKSAQNYESLSSVYFLRNDYKNATIALNKAYEIEKSEFLLDKLAAIYLLYLKDSNTAIALYEKHIKENGITKLSGEKLALIYVQLKQYNKGAKIYEELFLELGSQEYAKRALEIYFKTQHLNLAKKFLEKNPKIEARDSILLEIYRLQKDYKKSIMQARILYENTQDINFLAFSAMMEYESMKKYTKENLVGIERDLKNSAIKSDDALYWNYLGYLMIDHDFKDEKRISEGMRYVKKALEKEPQNPYYLDSLAWGYYKLKECESAKDIMLKIPHEEIQKEEEIKAHYKMILQCEK